MNYHYQIVNSVTPSDIKIDSRNIEGFEGFKEHSEAFSAGIEKRKLHCLSPINVVKVIEPKHESITA